MTPSLAEIARAHLRSHGLNEEIVRLVEFSTSPAHHGDGQRGNLSIGYESGKGRRETATISLPTIDEAVAMLADRDRIGAILSLGIRAIPAMMRPAAPTWITENDGARRTLRDLKRAKEIAENGADGIPPKDSPAGDGDMPF